MPRSFHAITRQLLAATVEVAVGVLLDVEVGVGVAVAVEVGVGVRVAVEVGVGVRVAVEVGVGTAVCASPASATDWFLALFALLVTAMVDLYSPLARGEKRTFTILVLPAGMEKAPAPSKIENGDAGEATLPLIEPPDALTENESSSFPLSKVSDFGLTLSLVCAASVCDAEAAITVETDAIARPENKSKLTNRFIPGSSRITCPTSIHSKPQRSRPV